MQWYIWVLIVILLIIFIIVLFGRTVAEKITKPLRKSLLETSQIEEKNQPGLMKFYEENKTAEYQVITKDLVSLEVYYFKNKEETNKYIIMSHGHTYTHHGCIKYAKYLMQYGYNVVMYDQRYHGNSEGKFTSLGYLEKNDLDQIITDSINRYGKDIHIGTLGISMGAATVILEAEKDKRVEYIISDCGYESLSMLLDERFEHIKFLPKSIVLPISSYFFKKITGSSFNGISPIKALNNIDVPILFVHGKDDNFINYHHSVDMYEKYKGPKELFLAGNNSLHAQAYLKDRLNYEKVLTDFIKKYLPNEK